MKPKNADLFLVVLFLATLFSSISLIRSLMDGTGFLMELFASALFGYFLLKYWRKGKIKG